MTHAKQHVYCTTLLYSFDNKFLCRPFFNAFSIYYLLLHSFFFFNLNWITGKNQCYVICYVYNTKYSLLLIQSKILRNFATVTVATWRILSHSCSHFSLQKSQQFKTSHKYVKEFPLSESLNHIMKYLLCYVCNFAPRPFHPINNRFHHTLSLSLSCPTSLTRESVFQKWKILLRKLS